jgi:hypothetical protein
MELLELKNRICEEFLGTDKDLQEILQIVEKDQAVFPFNEYEHLICNLIEKKGLSYDQYIEIRSDYIAQNPNLWIFEISAPRGFGEKFAQTYIHAMCHKLVKPNKNLDSEYTGQYDIWLDGIKIEVKASRGVESKSDEPLYIKALSRKTGKNFLMNFQQLKPQCCDVFIWVAVFRDEIILWVLNSDEVKNNEFFSKGQHRGNKGNEGQLHINQNNIHTLDKYKFKEGGDLGLFIKQAALRR